MRVVVQLSRGWSWYQICSLVGHRYTTVARLKLLKDASLALQRNQLFKIKLESQIEWCCCDLNALAIANHNARLTSNCFFDYHRCDYFCQEYFYGRKDEERKGERDKRVKHWVGKMFWWKLFWKTSSVEIFSESLCHIILLFPDNTALIHMNLNLSFFNPEI